MDKNIRLMRRRVDKQPRIDIYERCVLCWELTDVPKRMPISLRDNYCVIIILRAKVNSVETVTIDF